MVSHFIGISFDGSISLFQAHQLTSACNLDIHPFPFDEQKCNLTIVPTLHEGILEEHRAIMAYHKFCLPFLSTQTSEAILMHTFSISLWFLHVSLPLLQSAMYLLYVFLFC